MAAENQTTYDKNHTADQTAAERRKGRPTSKPSPVSKTATKPRGATSPNRADAKLPKLISPTQPGPPLSDEWLRRLFAYSSLTHFDMCTSQPRRRKSQPSPAEKHQDKHHTPVPCTLLENLGNPNTEWRLRHPPAGPSPAKAPMTEAK